MNEQILAEIVKDIDIVKYKLLNIMGEPSVENSKNIEDFITLKEAAKYLGVSLPTLYSYTNKSLLKKYKLGGRMFYKKSELVKAIQ